MAPKFQNVFIPLPCSPPSLYSMNFEVSGSNVTGLDITSLDIEERGSYSAARWIRHITMPESYCCRT